MQDKEKMFLDLNSVLVKFWIENNRPDKTVKIELLERMLNWYKKMGYVTLDKQEEKNLPEGLEEAAEEYLDDNLVSGVYSDFTKATFIAGVKWDRAKMMEKAVEGKVIDNGSSGTTIDTKYGVLYLPPLVYAVDDKVKVIIMKEDKL